MVDALFLPDGGSYVPTELTRGPWAADAQHGGPPAALLGTVMEQRHQRGDGQIVRVTVEILRPVPMTPLRVATEVIRPGRNVELLGASLHSGEVEVMRATAWRIRTTAPPAAADRPPERALPPGPDAGRLRPFFPTGHDVGYHTAMDARFVTGGFTEPGPATVWMRLRHPVVAGEEPSPLSRVLVAADSGNGVSGVLDYRRWVFINPDLTVYLHRMPRGEWVCLDARTTVEPHGVGLAESVLSDVEGLIGRGLQSLYVAERPG